MAEFDEPREVEIQMTREFALSQMENDEDSLDEDAIFNVDYEIGQSRHTIEIISWNDIPKGYEPVHESDEEEFNSYQEADSDYEDLG